MKNIFLKSSLFCLFLLTFSCAKKTDYLQAGGDASFMKAKVNGKQVECTVTTVTIYDTSPKTIQITGNTGNEGFGITLNDYKGTGKYTLGQNGIATYIADSKNAMSTSYSTFDSSVGTVNITSVTSTIIEGTFEFKGKLMSGNEERVVTEGSFSISLVVPTAPKPNTGNTNMSAKIDGTNKNFTGQGALIKSSLMGNVMTITGVNGNEVITIGIFDYNGVGTYVINDQTSHMGGYVPDNRGNNSFGSKTGKIIVTSSTSNSIKGTFEFEAPNDNFQVNTKVVVTEGKFDMSYSTTTM